MAILESLYILFKGDASSVKKSAHEAETSVKSFLNVFAGVASAAAIFSSFKASINEVSTIGNLSRELNVNVEALNAWQNAVQRSGGSAEGFNSSLRSLASHFGTTPQLALRLLPKLANVFSKFNQNQANAYGKSLGIDQATIYLLQQGRREVEATIKQQQKLGLVTKEQVEITRKYDNALFDAGRAYRTFYRELAIPLLPGITKVIEYLIEHKIAVVGSLGAIAAAATAMGAAFFGAARSVKLLTSALGVGILGAAIEDVYHFTKGDKKTALGKITGFEGGVPEIQVKADEKLSHAPLWFQKLIGIKAPDYALNRIPKASGIALKNKDSLRPNVTIDIGDVNINTAATDGKEIAASFVPSLKDQLFQANSHFDNGIMS